MILLEAKDRRRGGPCGTRTCNQSVMSRRLQPLSYRPHQKSRKLWRHEGTISGPSTSAMSYRRLFVSLQESRFARGEVYSLWSPPLLQSRFSPGRYALAWQQWKSRVFPSSRRGSPSARLGGGAPSTATVASGISLPLVLAIPRVGRIVATTAVIVRAHGDGSSDQCNGDDGGRSLVLLLNHVDALDWVNAAPGQLAGVFLRKG